MRDVNDFYLKKEVISTFILKESLEKEYIFEQDLKFSATIPYKLATNKIIHNFSNENKDSLSLDLYRQYKILVNHIVSNDLKNCNEFTMIRFNDFTISYDGIANLKNKQNILNKII